MIGEDIGVERADILGVSVDALSEREACERLVALWHTPGAHQIVTINPELIMASVGPTPEAVELKQALQTSAMVVADGIGVVWASRVLGTPLPERVPGIDLVGQALSWAAKERRRLFLLGGRPGVAQAAAGRLSAKYEGLRVSGTHHGYFAEHESDGVVADIASRGVDLLLVGIGAPRQELWIARNRAHLGARVTVGVGGAFDVFAGHVRRAPLTLQRLGLEWAYRLACEPRRARRMAALPRFVAAVLWTKWQGGHR